MTVGELVDYCSTLDVENKIIALQGHYKSPMYCLDYYLTQRDLSLARLSTQTETHVAPVYSTIDYPELDGKIELDE